MAPAGLGLRRGEGGKGSALRTGPSGVPVGDCVNDGLPVACLKRASSTGDNRSRKGNSGDQRTAVQRPPYAG